MCVDYIAWLFPGWADCVLLVVTYFSPSRHCIGGRVVSMLLWGMHSLTFPSLHGSGDAHLLSMLSIFPSHMVVKVQLTSFQCFPAPQMSGYVNLCSENEASIELRWNLTVPQILVISQPHQTSRVLLYHQQLCCFTGNMLIKWTSVLLVFQNHQSVPTCYIKQIQVIGSTFL